jgi:predicted site-specific integrase-resolvase
MAPVTLAANLLTTVAAAEYLGVAPQTLAVWRIRGTGPVFLRVRRIVRYRREDLDRWLAPAGACDTHIA